MKLWVTEVSSDISDFITDDISSTSAAVEAAAAVLLWILLSLISLLQQSHKQFQLQIHIVYYNVIIALQYNKEDATKNSIGMDIFGQ